jgi:tRNA threonylcarbamoyladenosine biosynthesis protein TsaB
LRIVLILALDTSSAAGSVAIVRDGAVIVEREGDGSRTHGERLPLELMAILREAGLSLADIDSFAVVTGPGSFTGLRVGIATIQGLALAQRKRVAPVSTFEAHVLRLKGEATYPGTRDGTARTSDLEPRASELFGIWIDAHRREVYAALYSPDGRATLGAPTSLLPDATIDAWMRTMETGARVRFAGDGAVRYADVIRAGLGPRAIVPATVPALAGAAGLIAAADPGRAVLPHALVPLYLRRSDAELTRDRGRTEPRHAGDPHR